jgi:hypothetical protein
LHLSCCLGQLPHFFCPKNDGYSQSRRNCLLFRNTWAHFRLWVWFVLLMFCIVFWVPLVCFYFDFLKTPFGHCIVWTSIYGFCFSTGCTRRLTYSKICPLGSNFLQSRKHWHIVVNSGKYSIIQKASFWCTSCVF